MARKNCSCCGGSGWLEDDYDLIDAIYYDMREPCPFCNKDGKHPPKSFPVLSGRADEKGTPDG